MRRRLLTLAVVALAALTAGVAAFGAEGQPRITEAVSSGFPDRAFVLTLPRGMTLTADAVEAAQSGHPGTPMGAADLAFVLWTEFLRFDS